MFQLIQKTTQALFVLLLCSCSNPAVNRVSAIWAQYTVPLPPIVEPNIVATLPRPVITVARNNDQPTLAQLQSSSQDLDKWVTADRRMLITQNLRLTRILGLGENWRWTLDGIDPLLAFSAQKTPGSLQIYASGRAEGLSVKPVYTDQGLQSYRLPTGFAQLRTIEETIHLPWQHAPIVNTHWLSVDNKWLATQQVVNAQGDHIRLEVLKAKTQ